MKCSVCRKKIYNTQRVVRLMAEIAKMDNGDQQDPKFWTGVSDCRAIFVAHEHCARFGSKYREEISCLAISNKVPLMAVGDD